MTMTTTPQEEGEGEGGGEGGQEDIRLKVFMWTWRYPDREHVKKMLAHYDSLRAGRSASRTSKIKKPRKM